jgi:hypothetical protein
METMIRDSSPEVPLAQQIPTSRQITNRIGRLLADLETSRKLLRLRQQIDRDNRLLADDPQ